MLIEHGADVRSSASSDTNQPQRYYIHPQAYVLTEYVF